MTGLSLLGEKLYLVPTLDLHSNDLVSYAISYRLALNMVTTMISQVIERILDDTSLILHSILGWQYQYKQY